MGSLIRSSHFKLLNKLTAALLFSALAGFLSSNGLAAVQCKDIFNDSVIKKVISTKSTLTDVELLNYVSKSISKTEEFRFIRAEAKKMKVRVWMFGGTASSFLHYAKWDLSRQEKILNLQGDRFDYDFTNIFRSTQDLDIVVDGTMEQIQALQNLLSQKFPYFVGSKKAWEVRSLRTPIGKPGDGYYKEALLNDPNFSNQNTDTNSLAMVEISETKEPVVRDLRAWTTGKNQFLEDALNNTISYLRNPLHHTTARAKMGLNPEILSVMRLLVKAFQYDLAIDPKSMSDMKDVISKFEPKSVSDQSALRRMNEIASKLVMHSNNIERAMNVLDQLGLRQKLISMNLKDATNDATLWLNKEPLRSFEISKDGKVTQLPKYTSGLLKAGSFKPTGKTAKDLGIQIVAHETNSFLAYESITKSHTGEPNVLISRNNAQGEAAAYGDGFYTQTGRRGARGTGLTIRFNVDPSAREGVDFTVHSSYVVFLNKKALTVIQESLNLGIVELVDMMDSGKFNLDSSDKGIFEKLKRRLNANRIEAELEKLMRSNIRKDQKKFKNILTSMVTNPKIKDLVAEATVTQVVKQVYNKLAPLKDSRNENDILKYINIISPILPELIKSKALTKDEFKNYLIHKKKEGLSTEVVCSVVIELALSEGADRFIENLNLKDLDTKAKSLVIEKIKSFSQSKDHRKQTVFNKLSEEKESSFKENNARKLENLLNLDLIDLNVVNISGHSLLLEAAYYEAQNVIDFLISNRDFNVDRKNKHGRNDVEELRLLGKDEVADYIEQKMGQTKSKKLKLKERSSKKTELYPAGEPIIDSVRIEPGTFMMGDTEKVSVTLTKAFDIMSVDTTNRMWKGVVELINTHSPRQFNLLKEDPLRFKGLEYPVESISHDDITQQWLVALNQLSNMKNKAIQNSLAELFPGHFLGKKYRLPTEAEWEYVSRVSGLATGDYGFGNTVKSLDENAWHDKNSGYQTHPVGLKKPIMINGKPVYDLHGNVWKWIQDSWDGSSKLPGGVDPVGKKGSYRVMRGGSWYGNASSLRSGGRSGFSPDGRSSVAGFRLVSDIP
jgi:formylglycine-generating enzyme required for sulfatase activity